MCSMGFSIIAVQCMFYNYCLLAIISSVHVLTRPASRGECPLKAYASAVPVLVASCCVKR